LTHISARSIDLNPNSSATDDNQTTAYSKFGFHGGRLSLSSWRGGSKARYTFGRANECLAN
jgi:hypothetical protein